MLFAKKSRLSKRYERRLMTSPVSCIGRTVTIRGELSSAEDIAIAGRVEGKVELRDHILTIAPTAHVAANVAAKAVIVGGSICGDIVGLQRVDIQNTGSVKGDIAAPRIAMSEGAHLQGRVEMPRS
jgi:cytoskeletal protein CcmA (bactofilin family)